MFDYAKISELKVNQIAVVITALNEARSISKVVTEVSLYGFPIVVDDGSIDETAILAECAGAIVVKHAVNKGYEAALESGLFKAIELGFKYAVTLDADGQHFPQTLLTFKEELIRGADLVVGARDHYQRFAEVIFSQVSKLFFGVQDPLCGMKGYKLTHLSNLGYFDSYRSIGTEFALRCARGGLNIRSVSVRTQSRLGQSRFGSGLRPNIRILRAMIIGIFRASSFDE